MDDSLHPVLPTFVLFARFSRSTAAAHSSLVDDTHCWFVIGFFAAALYLVYVAKQRVDAAAKVEDRAASNEDKSYKAALDKLEAPRAAVTKAAESYRLALLSPPPLPEGALDSHVTAAEKVHCDAVRAMMSATGKAEEQKPIVGGLELVVVTMVMENSYVKPRSGYPT
ncbi:hypothetical protein ZWY2020_054979 [Hordeum vulgare]|nr:hypothetical protein ZWY2020_054979 [Hordeum vulgare]